MPFKDHFSRQATDYTRFRPHYPVALFEHLGAKVGEHALAWDCATGSGQAAQGLAPWFDSVIATDASARQIASAKPCPGVHYLVCAAEQVPLAKHSTDLVTVAQALHWFDLERFYEEVHRVLRPGGAFVAWSYNLLRIEPDIDAVIDRLYGELLGEYWPAERRHVETGYADLPFPFEPITMPPCDMHAEWTLAQLLGYLGTWSAVQKYRGERGEDPVEQVQAALADAWGAADRQRPVRWPLAFVAGRPA